jgi:membrane protein implicated in regulation of membrane protease activity
LKNSFQIVVSAPSPHGAATVRPGILARLKTWLGGFLLIVFLIGTFLAALLISSVLALLLWVAVVIVLVAVIVRVALQQAVQGRVRKADRLPTRYIGDDLDN